MLHDTLSFASPEERLAVTRILHEGAKEPLAAAPLRKEISLCAGHGIFNFLRGDGVSYSELLYDAAGHLKVEEVVPRHQRIHGDLRLAELDRFSLKDAFALNVTLRVGLVDDYVSGLERKILSQLMQAAYEKATPQQRAEIDAKVAALAKSPEGKSLSGLSTSAALLALGNLGGFATYTMMSTVLSALSFGTLGFGAYTFASSALSVVLGPAGWLSLAAYAVYKYGGPDAGKVVRLAATCAMTSQRLRANGLFRLPTAA